MFPLGYNERCSFPYCSCNGNSGNCLVRASNCLPYRNVIYCHSQRRKLSWKTALAVPLAWRGGVCLPLIPVPVQKVFHQWLLHGYCGKSGGFRACSHTAFSVCLTWNRFWNWPYARSIQNALKSRKQSLRPINTDCPAKAFRRILRSRILSSRFFPFAAFLQSA